MIYKINFELALTQNTKWTLTKRNKSKVQTMDMAFLKSNEGNTRRDRNTKEIFREAGIQNLLA
jgi:hypothetical protein